MNYFQGNKEAWEEAFDHRHPGWGEANHEKLVNEELPFFCPDLADELRSIHFAGNTVAQFCCNNGRELLSLMGLGAQYGVGFDIADNIIGQAIATAKRAGITQCDFVACNILDIPPKYDNFFDFILFTAGALTWFQDINALLKKVSHCLKPGGTLLIHDFHPLMNMLPMPGEPGFDPQHLGQLAYSYFRTEPWLENEGMGYMSEQYASKTFISYSHTLSSIVNAICAEGLRITKLNEYDYDVGLSDVYDHRGLPLSYLLRAEKGIL